MALMQNRNSIIDIVRGIAIIIVVLGHALQASHGGTGNALHNVILLFQMELFFVVAGFVSAYSKEDNVCRSLKRKFLRLAVPYLVWVAGFELLRMVVGHHPWSFSVGMNELCCSMFWFLREMWVVVSLFTLSRFIERKSGKIIAVGCFLSATYGVSFLPGEESVFRYSIWFLGGYLMNCQLSRLIVEKSNLKCHWLEWCGQNSLGIYAVHTNVFMNFCNHNVISLRKIAEILNCEYFAAFVGAVIWMVLSVVIIIMVKRVKVLRCVLLGEW